MSFKYYSYENEQQEFITKLRDIIYNEKKKRGYLELVFLCIGTDRMIGDCFGPLVGTKLEENFENYNINIYGTLEKNVSYTNIKEIVTKIKKQYKNPYIIAIDSALSKQENIGKIFLSNEKLILGKCLNKNKIEVGNLSIKAVVGKNYKITNYNFYVLQNTSLNKVIKLANVVADGITEVIKYA